MKFIKKLPLPIAGLSLGLAALGNLFKDIIPFLRPVFGFISLLIVLMLIIKFILMPKESLSAMENPVVAGTMATFPMAITILSSYISNTPAKAVYFVGLAIHIILILWFTKKFVLSFDIKKVFTTWFIMYVGIVAGSVAAPNVSMQNLGKILFYFGLFTYVILLVIVLYRVIKVKNIPDAALPTLCIFAAPASLLLAGYNASFSIKNINMVKTLLIFSLLFFIVGALFIILYSKLPFYPSISAHTFPFVISAIATKTTNAYFIKSGVAMNSLPILVTLQTYLALALVLVTLIRYLVFLSSEDKKQP